VHRDFLITLYHQINTVYRCLCVWTCCCKSVHCQSQCNLHPTYHTPGTKQTAGSRQVIKLAHFQIHPPPLNIFTVSNWPTVSFHKWLAGPTVNIVNTLFPLAPVTLFHCRNWHNLLASYWSSLCFYNSLTHTLSIPLSCYTNPL
jgi:hypothetical protein